MNIHYDGGVSLRFEQWLDHWNHFHQQATVGGKLAVIDTLAALVPDHSFSLLEELEMWAAMCGLRAAWGHFRTAFEYQLRPLLTDTEMAAAEMPGWYPTAFHQMALPCRRAALLIAFLDFALDALPSVERAPFATLQAWLVAMLVASPQSSILGATLDVADGACARGPLLDGSFLQTLPAIIADPCRFSAS